MVLAKSEHQRSFAALLQYLSSSDLRNVLSAFLRVVYQKYLPSSFTTEDNSHWWKSDAPSISAAAGLIKLVIAGDETRKNFLVLWLTNSTGAGIGDSISIRRAVVASLVGDKLGMETILEKSLQQFGDQLYIRHTPTLQQEGTQVKIVSMNVSADERISPCSSASPRCGIRSSYHPTTSGNDDEIRSSYRCGLKQTCCILKPISLSRNGRWRSSFQSCRQRRQEDGLQSR